MSPVPPQEPERFFPGFSVCFVLPWVGDPWVRALDFAFDGVVCSRLL